MMVRYCGSGVRESMNCFFLVSSMFFVFFRVGIGFGVFCGFGIGFWILFCCWGVEKGFL